MKLNAVNVFKNNLELLNNVNKITIELRAYNIKYYVHN